MNKFKDEVDAAPWADPQVELLKTAPLIAKLLANVDPDEHELAGSFLWFHAWVATAYRSLPAITHDPELFLISLDTVYSEVMKTLVSEVEASPDDLDFLVKSWGKFKATTGNFTEDFYTWLIDLRPWLINITIGKTLLKNFSLN